MAAKLCRIEPRSMEFSYLDFNLDRTLDSIANIIPDFPGSLLRHNEPHFRSIIDIHNYFVLYCLCCFLHL